ncbi:MAG TPA: PaaI family thioesterase [Burkholderiaceae bacterium]|nr:PaaI family thioesterase [Burkholderiaceae bacterium]
MISPPEGFVPLPVPGEFIRVNGPLYIRKQAGTVQLGFRVEERHANPMAICHGGMMASFCDMLLPIATLHMRREIGPRFLPTVSLQIDYLAPAPVGSWVEGETQVLRVTRTMIFAQGLVTADGEPVARASGILKIGSVFPGLDGAAG